MNLCKIQLVPQVQEHLYAFIVLYHSEVASDVVVDEVNRDFPPVDTYLVIVVDRGGCPRCMLVADR
jgi:hypothetical protein